MSDESDRRVALDRLKQHKQHREQARTVAPPTVTVNGDSRILALNSSPTVESSGSTSRFFPEGSRPPPPPQPGFDVRRKMQADAPLGRPKVQPELTARPPVSFPSSSSINSLARDDDGQPPRKKFAAASRESSVSDHRASPVPSMAPGTTRASSAVPTRLQEGFEHVNIQSGSSGSPLATSGATSEDDSPNNGTASSPIQAEPTRLKRRLEPSTETPPAQSWTSSHSPSTTNAVASQMKPELLRKVFPKLSIEEIEDTIALHPFESPTRVVLRLRALDSGQIFRDWSQNTSPAATPVKKRDAKLTSAIYANRGDKKHLHGEASTQLDTPRSAQSNTLAERPRTKKRRVESESGSDWDDDSDGGRRKGDDVPDIDEDKALEIFNTCEVEELTGSIACSADQAEIIKKLRPYKSVEDLRKRLTKARGVSPSVFDQYIQVMQGYIEVDRCLTKCEAIGKDIADVMSWWTGQPVPSRRADLIESGTSTPNGTSSDTGLHVMSVDAAKLEEMAAKEQSTKKRKALQSYIKTQPAGLKEGVHLKDYQLLGLNWLNLLYSKGLSCILADDMGLGKTIQVIAFLQLLKERNIKGPHLIIVPSSTLENWAREFQKFAPDIDVQTYYGSQADRRELQHEYREMFAKGELEVLLTTYDLAWKEDDSKFLRKRIDFECCIFDEGHTLKNFQSQRYTSLLRLQPKWRLLLTGTPLQNNLQELVSLLNFMQPNIFKEAEDRLRQIFKVHSKGTVNMLSQQRVSRARTMMTPFVLRRRKAQVLLDLPPRTERVVQCRMTHLQAELYDNALRKNRSVIEEVKDEDDDDDLVPKGKKKEPKIKDDTTNNVLMDLRKAASHPLLFRSRYTDAKVRQLAKAALKEEEFRTSVEKLVIEDMEIMTDAELHFFCKAHPKYCGKFALDEQAFWDVGKMEELKRILDDCRKHNKRILLFSQLTQILDILGTALDQQGIKWIRLDGSTRVDERQQLVDEFTEDESIKVFLLSTRAGGMGINLVAACVVVIYDQDFNPHNDRQAADRAYRIGQTREVEVVKLISQGSIDEDMLQIGITKLQLDDAVGGFSADGDADTGEAKKTETAVKKSLLTNLRAKLEIPKSEDVKEEVDDVKMD